MMIPGEIRRTGSYYAAMVEVLGAYAQGTTRESACTSLAITVQEIATDHRPLEGFQVTVTDDGDATLYLTSNDAGRLIATLLRCQRELHDMSLADVAEATGARSRNGYAQYEQGRADPSITKLQDLLDAVAPDLAVAIVPRTARVIPRWDEEADDAIEVEAIMRDPSEANIRAFVARRRLAAPKRKATRAAR
jgi:transcriptional regulator with XRE-family HTH domain/predicted RNase H-like HicB family nuclease